MRSLIHTLPMVVINYDAHQVFLGVLFVGWFVCFIFVFVCLFVVYFFVCSFICSFVCLLLIVERAGDRRLQFLGHILCLPTQKP